MIKINKTVEKSVASLLLRYYGFFDNLRVPFSEMTKNSKSYFPSESLRYCGFRYCGSSLYIFTELERAPITILDTIPHQKPSLLNQRWANRPPEVFST